ncbi:MAG TPA: hypothetical protein QF873_01570 [Patescibacteria group bacterium]|nr:hypothetical protein [Patescibacteria group bacterium]
MNKYLDSLLKAVKNPATWPEDGEKIKVSRPGRTAGFAYEKVRNAVEYEEEHLLRRNAILRILMRRQTGETETEMTRGQSLLTELIWAKHLPNDKVPANLVKTVDAILKKYDTLLEAIPEDQDRRFYEEWIYDVMSTEVEYAIESPQTLEHLASFMFEKVKGELVWSAEDMEDAQKDMLVYVAIYRALLKSNLATLRYRVFTLYFPKWSGADSEAVRGVATRLGVVVNAVEEQIKHPYADQLYRLMRRYALVFWTLHDIAKEKPDNFYEILNDDEKLLQEVRKSAYGRYDRFKLRLRRTVGRAVLFLFLTKMLLALVIEVPYEMLILGEIAAVPLAINILFHPLFLAIIGMTVSIPKKKNTQQLLEYIKSVMNPSQKSPLGIVFKVRKPWSQGVLGKFFTGMYALTYLFSYGAIAWVLTGVLHFNLVSTGLFLFFFSIVTFFGIKIRQSIRELLVIDKQGGVFGTVFDFFLLPVVRVGRWISLRAPRVNIFIFFLDFIVEAPFKLAIELAEAWIAFMREQKEDL